jgi:hypothetical protein
MKIRIVRPLLRLLGTTLKMPGLRISLFLSSGAFCEALVHTHIANLAMDDWSRARFTQFQHLALLAFFAELSMFILEKQFGLPVHDLLKKAWERLMNRLEDRK